MNSHTDVVTEISSIRFSEFFDIVHKLSFMSTWIDVTFAQIDINYNLYKIRLLQLSNKYNTNTGLNIYMFARYHIESLE